MSDHVDVRLQEWSAVSPDGLSGQALRGRWLDGAATRRVAESLSRTRVLHVDELRAGIAIRATSYVGRVQLGTVRVTIEPKISKAALLSLFRYAFGLRRLTLVDASSTGSGAFFLDVLLHQLRLEVSELTRRGLSQRYVEHHETLDSPRGRIDIERFATRGGALDARLPCRYAPRTTDHILNRAVAATVRLAAALAQDPALRQDFVHLARSFDGCVMATRLDLALLARARSTLTRLTSAYEPTLTIAGMLLHGTSIALDDGSALPIPGFLFDMNRFFQALVERFLTDYLTGYRVSVEEGRAGMMRYVENPRNRRAPTPRPDFTVRGSSTRSIYLLDAKYRDLWDKPLPREMLYQLALYAISQPSNQAAAMIFPSAVENARPASIEVRDPVSGKPLATVFMRPLNVEHLAHLLEAPDGLVGLGELAREVAFGETAPSQPIGVRHPPSPSP